MMPPEPPALLFAEGRGARFRSFTRPERVLLAREAAEVPPVLAALDAALAAGRFVAGYLAYEAAAAFGLRVRAPSPDGPPLAWFGVYAAPGELEIEPPRHADGIAAPQAQLSGADHAAALAHIQELIGRGDTYQVNFTFPLEADLAEEPWTLFRRLVAVQPVPYAAYLDLGRFAIASVSPELFFEQEGNLLRTRPMKGTAQRGLDLEDDARAGLALSSSTKDRAENLMIVDMLRNDLGRIAETGSVVVPAAFEVERHPTLLQMTSTVEARSAAPLSKVLEALFPCASVTGAPKVRTMEIIAELEAGPRGVYTGAIGWAGAGRARFSVAIRTAVLDRERRRVGYGVGSGVLADSRAESEYAECLLKGRILSEAPFELLETMAYLPEEGLLRLEGHLARLRRSALYFGLAPDEVVASARALLEAVARPPAPTRVRLLVDLFGRARLELVPIEPMGAGVLRVGLAREPVDERSPWLRHKTTRREVYDAARRSRPDCDEALLYNSKGEVTEGTVWNVAVERPGGRVVTPPVECGLLPGVERAALLAEGRLQEGLVRVAELGLGQRLFLFNSVRGMREGTFVG
jgi:para-aminobenzoate synthetase/4-amino-4-deoxychorismate lyase